jgi:hypothetical protein
MLKMVKVINFVMGKNDIKMMFIKRQGWGCNLEVEHLPSL